MPQASVRPAKLADAVADHIQQLILEGVLLPNERLLSERELSLKLDVSRPCLRDAQAKLIEKGLLTADAHGACYVSDAVGKTFREPLLMLVDEPQGRFDCMEFRAIVEAAAAGFAAERASAMDLETLASSFHRMEEGHRTGDLDLIASADADFHFAIYGAAHNLMMLHVMQSLEEVVRSSVYLNRRNLLEHRRNPEGQLEEHRLIHEAIVARDPERAREAARRHMMAARQTQREIQDAEQRQEAAVRRLARHDLVAPSKRRRSST